MRRRTVTTATLDMAATLIRQSWPEGITRGELAERLKVNVSTWRTSGYEGQLVARHPDLYVERGRLYNDGDRTAILVSLKAAIARGEVEWAEELRGKWDALRDAPRGQSTLDDLEVEP